ncbi:hypothetical protein RF11_02135 [Thelohanellus kitauei]|uniref:Uncharacterized protein n=1 Tax=Thelohanellus kitauei TaxID=669202 RepID=A0A0C2M8L1_THEKT|nr:hypothetical protein RF11_02135 [Thelohanellus kitauei]
MVTSDQITGRRLPMAPYSQVERPRGHGTIRCQPPPGLPVSQGHLLWSTTRQVWRVTGGKREAAVPTPHNERKPATGIGSTARLLAHPKVYQRWSRTRRRLDSCEKVVAILPESAELQCAHWSTSIVTFKSQRQTVCLLQTMLSFSLVFKGS